jgi:hypothetical protein
MKVLNERYYGLIARCNSCGCLIGYEPNDVSKSQNISCPLCKFTLWVPFNPNYDGVIKESEEPKNEKSVV